jgi:hypothetical protein
MKLSIRFVMAGPDLSPHPEELRSGVSKDEADIVASWFETAL